MVERSNTTLERSRGGGFCFVSSLQKYFSFVASFPTIFLRQLIL